MQQQLSALATILAVLSTAVTALAAPGTDDPYFDDVIEVRPAPTEPSPATRSPATLRRRAARLRTTTLLAASVGYTGITGLAKLSAPTVEASFGVRFPGVSERLGIRISGFAAATFAKDEYSGYTPDRPRAFGVNVSVQVRWNSGFWIAPGFGILHFRGSLGIQESVAAPHGEVPDLPSLTLPELSLAVGWEFALTPNIAIQLAAQTGTAIVTLRAMLYGGLSIAL